jgi:hypothetical protein
MDTVFKMSALFGTIEDLYSPDLVTRQLGLCAYVPLREAVMRMGSEGALVLDFSEVRVMDSSFAGASILKLQREIIAGDHGEKYLLLTGTTESTEENVDATIKGHGLKLGLQVVDRNKQWRLLGQIEPNLDQTLILVNQRGTLTARELADQADMAINTSSNRLKKLFDLHLIRRIEETTENGRQHVYKSLFS